MIIDCRNMNPAIKTILAISAPFCTSSSHCKNGRKGTYMRTNNRLKVMKGPSFAFGTKTIYTARPTMTNTSENSSKPKIMNWDGCEFMRDRRDTLGLGVVVVVCDRLGRGARA